MADPKTQGMFDTVVRQALAGLTDDDASGAMIGMAQSAGPEQAIAEAVAEALMGVKEAAAGGGVEIPPEVMQSAAVALAQVMIALMVEAGVIDDPDAAQRAVVERFRGEPARPGEEIVQ